MAVVPKKLVTLATNTLPASTQAALFTISAPIKVHEIYGVVTTVIQTQACNTKLTHYGTTGASVDLCATADITAAAVGSVFHITGTLANALQITTSSCGVGQATPLVLEPGDLKLDCAATNTGSVQWFMVYEPVNESASVNASTGQTLTSITSVDRYISGTAPKALAQTGQLSLFTVSGRIKLLNIIGEITTVVQTQANNTKLTSYGTVGAAVDMCGVLNISAAAAGGFFYITGTLANAMVKVVSSAGIGQAAPLIIEDGIIKLDCAANNTGKVKWHLLYEPLTSGASVTSFGI